MYLFDCSSNKRESKLSLLCDVSPSATYFKLVFIFFKNQRSPHFSDVNVMYLATCDLNNLPFYFALGCM